MLTIITEKSIMEKTRFIIFAPSFNENSGGSIVLHHLCHLINESDLNVEAFIVPYFSNKLLTSDIIKNIKSFCVILATKLRNKIIFKTKENFNTPIFNGSIIDSDIIIYPEITFGNPLNGKNIIRWLLHKPGYHTNEIYYGVNELYFKFQDGLVNNFDIELSKLSEHNLYIPYFPLDFYNLDDTQSIRTGCAYSVRKGKNKELNQHPKNSICIDGLSHLEVSKIFKKVKRFISYDAYSGYAGFAALCGCEVIIIPDEGVNELEWQPCEKKRYGLAYGFDRLDWALSTRDKRLLVIEETQQKSKMIINDFITESLSYFSSK